jgi:hypothetical protein
MVISGFSFEIGTFTTGLPPSLAYKAGMESKLSDYRARTVYRIVTVLQAPFMMKDATGPFISDSSA